MFNRMMSLSSSLPTPVMNSWENPPRTGGGGSIWSAGMRTTWLAESTTMPISLPSTSTTMTRVIEVASLDSRPNLSRRSMIGITSPRRLMMPFTNEGALGSHVISRTRMTSFTRRSSSPYSSSPTEKLMNWRSSPVSFRSFFDSISFLLR